MRHPIILAACIAGVTAVAGCGDKSGDNTVSRAFQDVNVIDETNLNDVMLTVADPNEAVNYFARTEKESPERIDIKRGLAKSLVRAKRYTEAAAVWAKIVKMEDTTSDDSVDYADALIRSGDWARAEKTLDAVPPTQET
jgi:Flp pilus assembly protein TadD